MDEIRDPVEAIKWLSCCTDTILIAQNLHLFLEVPEVIQAIQNGVIKWKSTGCTLILVAPSIRFPLELEKLFHVIDVPLPGFDSMFALQHDMGLSLNVEPNQTAAYGARGLTEFEAETAFALVSCQNRTIFPEGNLRSQGSNDTKIRPDAALGTG